jgi:hypothetical protein
LFQLTNKKHKVPVFCQLLNKNTKHAEIPKLYVFSLGHVLVCMRLRQKRTCCVCTGNDALSLIVKTPKKRQKAMIQTALVVLAKTGIMATSSVALGTLLYSAACTYTLLYLVCDPNVLHPPGRRKEYALWAFVSAAATACTTAGGQACKVAIEK